MKRYINARHVHAREQCNRNVLLEVCGMAATNTWQALASQPS